MIKIENFLIRILLKNTWHLCVHNFTCQSAEININGEQEYECNKCHVGARTFRGVKVILVSVETNHPYELPDWQINKRGTNGICLIPPTSKLK